MAVPAVSTAVSTGSRAVPIDIRPSAAAVGAAAADAVLASLEAARRRGVRPLVGWPVGRTPRPVVDALRSHARAGRLDLHDVTFVLMDDYVELVEDPLEPAGDTAGPAWRRIAVGAPHSCRGTAEREIVEALNADLVPARRLPPDGLWSPDPRCPAAYDELLAAAGGVELFLVALGSGDGHIALNPPGTDRGSRTRVLEVADSTRAANLGTFPTLHALSDVPTHGVSVGLATITDARQLLVIAHGHGKRAVVAQLRAAAGFDPALPMTAVLDHRRVAFVFDVAAAGNGGKGEDDTKEHTVAGTPVGAPAVVPQSPIPISSGQAQQ